MPWRFIGNVQPTDTCLSEQKGISSSYLFFLSSFSFASVHVTVVFKQIELPICCDILGPDSSYQTENLFLSNLGVIIVGFASPFFITKILSSITVCVNSWDLSSTSHGLYTFPESSPCRSESLGLLPNHS